tara:strand:- start:235 stop:411 length:177 start_codon:yes stop_codon:yes gene_type:complete
MKSQEKKIEDKQSIEVLLSTIKLNFEKLEQRIANLEILMKSGFPSNTSQKVLDKNKKY